MIPVQPVNIMSTFACSQDAREICGPTWHRTGQLSVAGPAVSDRNQIIKKIEIKKYILLFIKIEIY